MHPNLSLSFQRGNSVCLKEIEKRLITSKLQNRNILSHALWKTKMEEWNTTEQQNIFFLLSTTRHRVAVSGRRLCWYCQCESYPCKINPWKTEVNVQQSDNRIILSIRHTHTDALTILDLKISSNPDKCVYWFGTLRRWTISKSVRTPGPWHSPTYIRRHFWCICTNNGTWL